MKIHWFLKHFFSFSAFFHGVHSEAFKSQNKAITIRTKIFRVLRNWLGNTVKSWMMEIRQIVFSCWPSNSNVIIVFLFQSNKLKAPERVQQMLASFLSDPDSDKDSSQGTSQMRARRTRSNASITNTQIKDKLENTYRRSKDVMITEPYIMNQCIYIYIYIYSWYIVVRFGT